MDSSNYENVNTFWVNTTVCHKNKQIFVFNIFLFMLTEQIDSEAENNTFWLRPRALNHAHYIQGQLSWK